MADESASSEREPNRLIHETSPYLLQHAYNPVEWRPWGREAFESARERGVPILLSVGYSTCYWCHVMERECFEDPEIAAIMNEGFVCIKLDREERPDVDRIYMTALQILQRGGGGWPMNMFLTPPGARGADDPGLRPFFGGTYFPPEPRGQMAAFPDVLRNVSNAWQIQQEQVLEQADRLTGAVRQSVAAPNDPVRLDQTHISQAFAVLTRIYDREHAGFGGAPKFPQPVYLDFLIDTLHTLEDPAIRDFVTVAIRNTLDTMSLGGIHDHVGGGFHRYATDARWIVPHFEKMLYDNALLASLYAKAFLRGGDDHDARVVRDILEYVSREMTDSSGMFYSAQDAEVNHREGQNYILTYDQIVEILGPEDAGFAADIYSVQEEGGNFRDPHHPEDGYKNILVLRARPDALAEEMGLELDELLERKGDIDKRLYDARLRRDQPGLDDKIITSWNGLMIAGMADGALALGDERFLDAAEKAARSVLGTMHDEDGVLLRTSRNGVAKTPAFLEDYAFLAHGMIALHRTNAASGRADLTFLNAAHRLTMEAFDRFADESGALYDTRPGEPDLIVRTQATYDGAVPSALSVMLHNLIDLHELTQERDMLEHAVTVLASISPEIAQSPIGTINSVRALYRLLRLDPTLADRFGPALSTPDEGTDDGVKILAAGERVRVPGGGSTELPIRIEIDEGLHINAHDPGVEDLVPLEVRIEGSDSVRVDVDYPAGTRYTGGALPDDAGPLMVHEGAVELTLRLSRAGEGWSGTPILLVTYQVCTDSACLQPRTVELDVAIDP